MCFDLDHSGLDSGRFVEGRQSVQGNVRDSDGAALAVVYETFERSPCFEQSHAAVVNDVAIFVARILIVSGLKREWCVNEIEIQIVEFESLQARIEGGFDVLGPVIGVP